MRRVLEQSFYELLEISPSATAEEIERAGERARRLYGTGSLAAYALLPSDVADALAARIDEAHEVLLDPERRAAYDARLPAEEARPARPPAEGAPPAPPPPQAAAAPPPPPVEAARPFLPPAGAPWTGELLRQAREARNLTVAQLADRTKLSRAHIEQVEAERFDLLPVAVYLRGIVMCIARELRLDGQKVARSYLERAAAAPRGGK